ncbi:penicillin acylase family protein [Salinisphaera sp. T31B1]|uniref:penicillin acylase family protein n=1 Tax=Salinisphaera sp. T31B1 TaxID=727963 RepID=UPI003341D56D
MFENKWMRTLRTAGAALLVAGAIGGCSSGGGDDGVDDVGQAGNDSGALTDEQINAPNGNLQATIRTTTGGVPHITADNLESAGFGSGYVQARDNVCIIADSIIRARGERAKFYGPGPNVADALPIGVNVVTDFSYKALGLLDRANEEFDELTPASQAMLRGFAAGYNKYVDETDPTALPAKCNQAPWVRDITAEDLYAYYQLVALYASGDNFVQGPLFAAVPPGVSPAPAPAAPATSAALSTDTPELAAALRRATPATLGLKSDYHERGMASNGWGIGGDMTENGRGALLANPHFPYTGNRRLYQSQITVPGVYNVNGAGLIGVAIPLIGFNEHVAWTHTVSTAQHFTLYDLTLKSGDPLTYIKDGQEKPITSKRISVEVNVGAAQPLTFQRDFYYSEYGPMLAANTINGALPAWGDTFAGRSTAVTYRDANIETARQVVDQWLAMGRADNLAEFQQPFKACGSVLWVNTMYADDAGRAFYIDGTSVPQLSQGALTAFNARVSSNPVVAALAASNLTLLDGSRSLNDWVDNDCNGRVGYAGMPRLQRSDYVQNSNDSYWATNPKQFLTGFSPLYGPTENILSPRTRMGLRMLENPTDAGLSQVAPAGSDGKFTGQEIIDALYSNRAYYAETLLDELRERCNAAGDTAIAYDDDNSRSVADGCAALAGWNGVYDLNSTGAQVFRVFIGAFSPGYPAQFSVAFDPSQPETTPGTPYPADDDLSDDPMLVALATGLNRLDQAGIDYDAPLADIQYQQPYDARPPSPTGAAAQPTGDVIPWHGNQNFEGGFNIVSVDTSAVEDGTRYPRYAPQGTIAGTGGLSTADGEGWLIGYGTSWHFGLNFSDAGPQGYGLVSYSQSDDPSSAHYRDQDERYSAKNYRKLLYSNADINADENLQRETITATID